MFKFIPNMRQSFLALYALLNPTYIIFVALSYITTIIYYYLMAIINPFIFTTLTPYLKTVYIILNLNKFYLGTALKIQRLLI